MPKKEEFSGSSLCEQEFLEQIYSRYHVYVCWLARSKCSKGVDVEEIVQNTWEALCEKWEVLAGLPTEKQTAYISSTVTNCVRMAVRKKKVKTCSLESIGQYGYNGTQVLERMFDHGMLISNFREAWKQVEPDVRELLERRYILEQTDAQIAAAMQLKQEHVRVYIFRARKAARKTMLKYNHTLEKQWKEREK